MEDLGSLRARLLLESENFKKGMNDARNELEKTSFSAKTLADSIKGDFDRIQSAAMVLGGAIAGVVGISAKTAIDFEKQMSRVKAISGATQEEFKSLEEAALDLGASTSKSASEVAIGMEDMAAMGFNVNEIIAAMPGVISAAEASGSDLATTAGIVAAALNSFQLEASDASRVADVLAMTANVSAASVDDMGYAFKYTAPIANSLGISMEEVAAAIGIMTNAGLEGSQAGTSLRQILLSLNNPTKEQAELMEDLGFSMKDSDGKAKSLSKIIGDLTKVTKDKTQADKLATIATLVGTEASSAMIAMMDQGVDQLDEFTDSLQNSEGASKAAADVMMDNVAGAYEEFTGALETAGIKLGNEFLPLLSDVIHWGTGVVDTLSEMDSSTLKAGLAFGGTTAAIALAITTIGKLAGSIKGLFVSMGPAGWLIAGVSVLGGLMAAGAASTKSLEERIGELSQKFEEAEALDNKITQFDELSNKSKLTNDEFARMVDLNEAINSSTDPTKVQELKDEYAKLQENSGLTNDELQTMIDLNGDLIDTVPEATGVITDQGNKILDTTEALKEYNEEQRKELQAQLELERTAGAYDYSQKLEERKDKLEEINKKNEKLVEYQEKIHYWEDQLRQANEDLNYLLENRSMYTDEEYEAARRRVRTQEEGLEKAKEELSEQGKKVLEAQKELDTINEEISGYEVIREQLAQLYLKQVDINAEKGNELYAIDQQIKKLDEQKKKLEETTPIEKKNTDQYKERVNQIDEQIDKLEDVRSQIEDLNREMGKPITKEFRINETTYKTIMTTEYKRRQVDVDANNRPKYHTGGVVTNRKIPKLHTGGFPSQVVDAFANAPMHNEIDIRALPREMILTEAQQANLFRLLDAGQVNHSNAQPLNDEIVVDLLRNIALILSDGLNPTVVFDARDLAYAIEPHVTEKQGFNTNRMNSFNGGA
ncbi:phage tail tape measure protein [Caldibacillus lycopersici]|uniref:Phage tail tape measure protein n=1 Tax=Perspicuibacillus lycopersici TaxID=1325689 RepID=A0AAE3IVE3_9BACI|nr:phage tail tape measure protein [Perspicuibacillus lycopersici]MCU9614074.1 phage tail tape measure protein [Perspicuibacillus lycopersici]